MRFSCSSFFGVWVEALLPREGLVGLWGDVGALLNFMDFADRFGEALLLQNDRQKLLRACIISLRPRRHRFVL